MKIPAYVRVRVLAPIGALVCTVGALGCQTDNKPMNEVDLCAEFAKRECETVMLSCSETSTKACEGPRAAACQMFVGQFNNGQRAFRSDNVDACLDQVKKTYAKSQIKAEDWQALRAKCSRVYAGNAKANEPCTTSQDCESSLICDKKRCGPEKAVSSGQNCGNPGEICPETEYCRQGDGIFVCTKRKEKGATCSDTEPCAPGLRCEGTCVERLPLKATCTGDDQCQSGYCDQFPPPGTSPTCLLGLSFAPNGPACIAYFGSGSPSADAGTAVEGGVYQP